MVIRQRAMQAEDKRERHDAILDAAERVLLRSPDRVLNVAEVADEAGLAKGTVYLYFPSKDELLLAVHERRVDGFFRDVIALVEGPPPVSIEPMFGLTRRHMIDPPLFLPLASRCFGLMAHSIPPEAAAAFRQRMVARLERAGRRSRTPFSGASAGRRRRAAAPQLRADPRPLADGGRVRRRELALRDGRPRTVAGLRLELSDRTRGRTARAVARNGRRTRCLGDCSMKPTFPFVAVITAVVLAAAGCAKQEPQTDAARPVMLAQVVPGSGAETAVFAGEVKPRYESDLAFRIGGKIVVRAVDAGARVTQGTGARAARSGRRRPAGRSGARAGRSSAERVRVRDAPSTSATRTCSSRSSSARRRSTRSATR